MITVKNYFQKVKLIEFRKLPGDLQKLFAFTKDATEDYTTWEHYEDSDVRVPVDSYIAGLNVFFGNKSMGKITENEARDYAKKFIKPQAFKRGGFDRLANSEMGVNYDLMHAVIKKGRIEIYAIKNQKVNFSFDLRLIYNELVAEKRVSKNEPKHRSLKKVVPKSQAQKPEKEQKTRPEVNRPLRIDNSEGKPIEHISEEIKFIKRYLTLHNRWKTRDQILNFLNAVKRSILELRIRKTSKFNKEIMQIQNQLAAACNVMKEKELFTLAQATIKRFSEIAGSVRIRFSTQYLKRFVGIQGKNITKEKAKNLQVLISKAIENNKIAKSDPYYFQITKVINSLKKFVQVADKNDRLAFHEETLNGLNGALGCNCRTGQELHGIEEREIVKKEVGVMSVEEARKQEYKTVNITGRWLKLIGKFCLPTQFFVYGLGGSGKTSFVLLFTQYLASIGFKILYVAGEQYDTPTFKELLNRLNIVAGDNYKIVGDINTLNPADFDFVVLDSKDHLEVDVNKFVNYLEQYPQQSFIVLSQAVKGGNFTGRERWRNTVDVMIQAENGIIRTGHDKNRWGGAGEMLIFDHLNQ